VIVARHLAFALLLVVPGCNEEPPDGHPPVARIVCRTSNSDVNCFLLANDGFNTEVTLDGSRSGDVIDDPEAKLPLTYAWKLPAGARVTSGDIHQPLLTVRGMGDLPLEVELTVTDPSGASGRATRIIGVTVPAPPMP
jgi:hypothetical protein